MIWPSSDSRNMGASAQQFRVHQSAQRALEASGYADAHLLQQFVEADVAFERKYSSRAIFQFARAMAQQGKMNTAMSAYAEAIASAWTLHRASMEKATFRAEIEELSRVISRNLSALHVGPAPRLPEVPDEDTELRVGWLSSQLVDGSASGELLLAMAQGAGRCTLTHVFTTESRTTRHSTVPGVCSLKKVTHVVGNELTGRIGMSGIDLTCGNGSTKPALDAIELSQSISNAGIDVLVCDSSMSDAAASVVMSLADVPLKLSICRTTPLVSAGIHRVVDMSHMNVAGVWTNRRVTSLAQGLSHRAAMPLDRARLGLSPKASILVAHVGQDGDVLSNHFVASIRAIIRNNPRVVVVLLCDPAAAGQVRQRIGKDLLSARMYLCSDATMFDSLTRAADVYLATFPQFDPQGVLSALEMSVPVCAIGSQAGSRCATLEQLLGMEHVVQTPEDYVRQAGLFVADESMRWRHASAVRSRITRYASIEHTASELAEIIAQEHMVQVNRAIAGARRIAPQRRLAVA
jgi:hypothetical protein